MVEICSPLGARVTAADSSPQFNIGARAFGNSGDVYIYTQYNTAGTGLANGHFVALVPSASHHAEELTLALSSGGWPIGVCQVGGTNSAIEVTAGAYFWALIEGQGTFAVASSCVGSVPLYTTSTAGVLDDAANGNIIRGVVINATVTGDGTRLATGTIRGGKAGAVIA